MGEAAYRRSQGEWQHPEGIRHGGLGVRERRFAFAPIRSFLLFFLKSLELAYNSNANPQRTSPTKGKSTMATKPKNAPPKAAKVSAAKAAVASGGGLMTALAGIITEIGVKESRTYRPVPTGINVLDYYNARYFMNHETKEYELFSGMPMGKLILKVGYTGTGKTTLCVQEGLALSSRTSPAPCSTSTSKTRGPRSAPPTSLASRWKSSTASTSASTRSRWRRSTPSSRR
jgi:hypothetical protein